MFVISNWHRVTLGGQSRSYSMVAAQQETTRNWIIDWGIARRTILVARHQVMKMMMRILPLRSSQRSIGSTFIVIS